MAAVILHVAWDNLRTYGMTSVWLVVGTLLLSTLAYLPARRFRRSHSIGRDVLSPAPTAL